MAKVNKKPSTELRTREDIRFLHPGYPDRQNMFLSLPRVDSTPTGTFGVHHATALLACQVIANNTFDNSRLTLDMEGQQQVTTPAEDILTQSSYYFIVDNGSTGMYFFYFKLFTSIFLFYFRSVPYCSKFSRLGIPARSYTKFMAPDTYLRCIFDIQRLWDYPIFFSSQRYTHCAKRRGGLV